MNRLVIILLLTGFNVVGGFILVPDHQHYVRTSVGDIAGSIKGVEVDGQYRKIRIFYGIPYAESPSASRRFQKPVPKASFSKPFDATGNITSCLQLKYGMDDKKIYSEDCLILNIYTPIQTSSKLSVMIFIHGGGFAIGSSASYHPERLSAYGDVIVVTINYRLAAYGFFSTGEASAPGNYGLWDQHLAIKWVHDNIEAFGGDNDRITIFGESAGSASVIYQALFPGNKGLFHRAIAESGSVTSPWAYNRDPTENAVVLSKALGCLQTTWREKMACLRSKSEQEMQTAINSDEVQWTQWLPVVDGDFLLDSPLIILHSMHSDLRAKALFNDVDLLIGINSMEGIISIGNWMVEFNISDPDNIVDATNQQVESYVASTLKKNVVAYKPGKADVLTTATIFEYSDWDSADNGLKRIEWLANMVGDIGQAVPAVQTANAHSWKNTDGRTYFYRFSTRPPTHIWPPYTSVLDGPDKASHGDELLYLFGFLPGHNATSQQLAHNEAVMTMWTNFAKSGDPNQPEDIVKYIGTTWPRYDTTSQSYLDITPTLGPGSVKQRVWAKRMKFWLDLVPALLADANKTSC